MKRIVYIDVDLEELIPAFMENRLLDVVLLKKAVNQEQFIEIKEIGHTLKGIGGGYGFDYISEIGEKLENTAVVGDMEAIKHLLSQLEVYLNDVEIQFVEV